MAVAPLATGLWGVLATPFHDDLSLDTDSLRRQVELHHAVGSTGLVALGVFGESARLTPDERMRVVRVVAGAAGDLPLVVGIAERDTPSAVASARQLADVAGGRAALMLQVPTAEPAALSAHLQAVHDATTAGVVVQDYPVSSGVNIASPRLLEALAQCPFVVAVKSEAPPTSAAIAELTGQTTVPVFGGLGGLGLLDELMAGASGAMTGFSHPEGLAAALHGWQRGGYEAAREAYQPWLPLVNFEAQTGVGLAIRKTSLHERGIFASAAVRPPAMPMPAGLVPLLRAHLAHIQAHIQAQIQSGRVQAG